MKLFSKYGKVVDVRRVSAGKGRDGKPGLVSISTLVVVRIGGVFCVTLVLHLGSQLWVHRVHGLRERGARAGGQADPAVRQPPPQRGGEEDAGRGRAGAAPGHLRGQGPEGLRQAGQPGETKDLGLLRIMAEEI